MTPERWQRIEELVHSALELAPGDRRVALARECADDPELRADVESLLAHQAEARDFISSPAVAYAASYLPDEDSPGRLAGQQVGPYRLIRELGRGGMGAVYLAARADDQYQKQVAIKLVNREIGDADMVRRFRNERQILAGLDHPNIAKLLDGGTTGEGSPYLVMDYVDGLSIYEYCDRRQLNTAARLQIFRRICSAVAYAHRNLVIHRDLKPSNILVTADGDPKLLDFGIAKLLSEGDAAANEQTATFARIMTPLFASPEQVRGETITTASDIYSLGVLLYGLLTGHQPYRFKNSLPSEFERVICDQEPERPSTVVTRSSTATGEPGSDPAPVTPASVGGARGEPAEGLRRRLRGDLDNIVMMAMRKEPERRYRSVDQLADDLRRYLERLPVIATNDTVRYRAGKFIRRHRVGVAAALLVMLALLGGILATAWQARAARRERDKAQRVSTFLQDMFRTASPDAKGVDVRVADLLDDASQRAKSELASDPEVMADVLLTLGRTRIALQQFSGAESDLRAAMEASLKANGELHPTTAVSMGWLGLALAYDNKLTEGEQISRRAVDLERKLYPHGHEDLAIALYSLGFNLVSEGKAAAAEPILQEALAMIRERLGERHGYYVAALGMLGRAHEVMGDLNGAEALYRQAIQASAQDDPRFRIFMAQSTFYLARLLMNRGNYTDAESLFRQSEAIYREQSGQANPSVGYIEVNLGRIDFLQANYPKSVTEYQQALDLLQPEMGAESPLAVAAQAGLGSALTRAGKPADGEPHLRAALDLRRKDLAAGDVLIAHSESDLGECLLAQRRYAEAEPLLLSGYQKLNAALGEQNADTQSARAQLASLYQATGRKEQAAQLAP